jgi:hypothetical protein
MQQENADGFPSASLSLLLTVTAKKGERNLCSRCSTEVEKRGRKTREGEIANREEG